jgi:hypothetical protein
MSPLPDDEVRKRMEAVRDRMLAATKAARTPKKPMPAPPADVVPPPPHAEPSEDREP